MELKQSKGIVQNLLVETDTKAGLMGAIMIATSEWNKATHYRCAEDGSKLELLWAHDRMPQVDKLPFNLEGEQEINDFVVQWLTKSAKWLTEQPDTDGDNVKGVRITNGSFYCVVEITPCWITYGK